MKRFIFGILLAVIGLVFSSFSFVWAAVNPWTYNGNDGLLGSFLGTGMLVPFVLTMIVMAIGILICACEAYRKK